MRINFVVVAVLFALCLAPAQAADDSLFRALGGRDGVTRIANEAIAMAEKDPRIGHTFSESDIPRVKEQLGIQFCALTGGGCVYEGHTMAESHQGLGLTQSDFNALVEILQIVMDRENIPFATQNRFLALLAPMVRDVITR